MLIQKYHNCSKCQTLYNILKTIIDNKIDINNLDLEGNGFIHEAVKSGDLFLVNQFINYGGNIDLLDKRGFSALHVAAKEGNLYMIDSLLKLKANPNQKTFVERLSPLMIAALENYSAVIELLLDHGAKPYLKNDKGENALMIASRLNHRYATQAILKGYNIKENFIKEHYPRIKWDKLNYRPMANHILLAMNTTSLEELSLNLYKTKSSKIKKLLATKIFPKEKLLINYGILNLSCIFKELSFDYNHIITFMESASEQLNNLYFNNNNYLKIKQFIKELQQFYPQDRIIKILINNDQEHLAESLKLCAELTDVVKKENSLRFKPIIPLKPKNLAQIYDSLAKCVGKIQQRNYPLDQDFLKQIHGKKFLEYTISVPAYNYDLIDAGVNLKICIGYGHHGQKIINKESFVAFLVKDKKIYYCIELDEFRIIQAKGKLNKELNNIQLMLLKDFLSEYEILPFPQNKKP